MNHTEDFDYKRYLQLIIKSKHLFVTFALAIMAGVTITSYLLPERYESKCTVFIEKSVISEMVKGIAVTPSFEDKLRVLSYTLKSRNLLHKVFDDLGLDINKLGNGREEDVIRDFQNRTEIKLKDKDGLFVVSFNDRDPRFARDFVNALVRRYVEGNVASKREESYDATRFFDEQISTLKAKLDEAEARANGYKRENGTVLAQSEAAVLAEISQAQQRIDEIAIKRRQLENMLSLARKNDPLKARLSQLKAKQQELGLVYTDIHPEVVEVTNEIATVKQQLQSGSGRAGMADAPTAEMEKISLELNSLRDNENSQRRFIASKQSLLRSIPAARTGLDELERERNSQKNLYDQLLAKRGQSEVSTEMEAQDKATTFRIVDPAILPTKPFSPQRVKMVLFGIVGGLAASFGLLLLLDYLDKSVRNIESLRSLGVQILAVVPTIENPLELQAASKRDVWFFGIAAICFLLILATIPLELMRSISGIFVSSYETDMGLKGLKNLTLR